METRNVTCIQCPMGCLVTVEMEAGEIMGEINKMRVSAPVQIGDVLLEDIAGTGADIIATKYVGEKTPTL